MAHVLLFQQEVAHLVLDLGALLEAARRSRRQVSVLAYTVVALRVRQRGGAVVEATILELLLAVVEIIKTLKIILSDDFSLVLDADLSFPTLSRVEAHLVSGLAALVSNKVHVVQALLNEANAVDVAVLRVNRRLLIHPLLNTLRQVVSSFLLGKRFTIHDLTILAAKFLDEGSSGAVVGNHLRVVAMLIQNVDRASVRHDGAWLLLHVHLLLLLLQVVIVVVDVDRLVLEARRDLGLRLLRRVHRVHGMRVLVLNKLIARAHHVILMFPLLLIIFTLRNGSHTVDLVATVVDITVVHARRRRLCAIYLLLESLVRLISRVLHGALLA